MRVMAALCAMFVVSAAQAAGGVVHQSGKSFIICPSSTMDVCTQTTDKRGKLVKQCKKVCVTGN